MRGALFFLAISSLIAHAQETQETQAPVDTDGTIEQVANDENLDDLISMDLEDLMNITVTSVSKKEENAFTAASAIYVITQEDLKNRNVNNLAEALRGAPGVQVSRRTTNSWEVSIRGFDNQFSNKLLVLIDGRTVYTPIFSGVYWDMTSTPIQDIERIEIIRGPGATLWGSNAVNGVINITTKHASKTTGGLLSLDYGSDFESNYFRYGDALDEQNTMFLRAYGEFQKYDSLDAGKSTPNRDTTHDDWDSIRSGLRFDWEINNRDQIRLSTDYYRQNIISLDTLTGTPIPHDYDADGFNTLGEFTREFSSKEKLTFQTYYDYYRLSTDTSANFNVHTWDLSTTYNFSPAKNHELTLGGGGRMYHTKTNDPTNFLQIFPEEETIYNFNAFVQDKITLVDDRLSLTLGSKFEENDYTGFDILPSARMTYTPNQKHTFWTAISKSIRTPNRYENNSNLLFGAAVGNHDVEPEELIAYELGYRVLLNPCATKLNCLHLESKKG
jgi:iron complex outermembrane recepter protein